MIKKLAWPPFSEMNTSMEPQGDAAMDIQVTVSEGETATPGYSTLVGHQFTQEENQSPMSVGVMSPAEDVFSDIEDAEAQAIGELTDRLISMLPDGSNVLTLGKPDCQNTELVLDAGHNLTNLVKNTEDLVNTSRFHKECGDSRFHLFRKKFDGFCLASQYSKHDDLSIEIGNICKHLRPLSVGLIMSRANLDLSDSLEKLGFEILSKSTHNVGIYLVRRNILNKTAAVRCYNNKDEDIFVSFKCDIAETPREKADGLQVYPSLGKDGGLLFSYKKAQDVMYHMGTVGYPIDIIFIGENNKVNKISKNIQPGSLDVFGCPNVKTVLEISGGLCDALGIGVGAYVSINRGEKFLDEDIIKVSGVIERLGFEKFFVKKSDSLNSGLYNVLNNKIYIINNNDYHNNTASIVKSASYINIKKEKIVAFDIDNQLVDKYNIKLYKHCAPSEAVFAGLDNESFSIESKDEVNIKLSSYLTDSFQETFGANYSVIPTPSKSFSGFNKHDRLQALKKISGAIDSNSKIIFVTKHLINKDVLNKIIQSEINIKVGSGQPLEFELLKIPQYFDSEETFNALSDRHANKDIFLYTNNITKKAGVPVPNEIKDKARGAIRYFDRADDICGKLIDNLQKNLSQYEKIQGNQEAITGSKGQYNQSVKRNSKMTKRMLLNIKEGLKTMNEIKDVSTTGELIDSIANSAKSASESVKEIFKLVDVLDSIDFQNKLTEKTGNMENVVGDLKLTLSRMRDYINSDILGILILSE
jgi:uncharacterized membrane protein (UPF0127 family)/methyl-accepting chemotaxis protein